MSVLKLLFIIVDRDKAQNVLDAIKSFGSIYEHTALARGTAKSDWLDVLGIGESEKALIFFSLKEENIDKVYSILKEDFKFHEPGRGVAFTVPVSAVGGEATLKIMSGEILEYLGGNNAKI